MFRVGQSKNATKLFCVLSHHLGSWVCIWHLSDFFCGEFQCPLHNSRILAPPYPVWKCSPAQPQSCEDLYLTAGCVLHWASSCCPSSPHVPQLSDFCRTATLPPLVSSSPRYKPQFLRRRPYLASGRPCLLLVFSDFCSIPFETEKHSCKDYPAPRHISMISQVRWISILQNWGLEAGKLWCLS